METKMCSRCKEVKEFSEFSKNREAKDGLLPECKFCAKERRLKLNYAPLTTGTKICSKCKVEKPVSAFNRDKYKKDGLCSQCKACNSLYNAKHRDKIAIRQKLHRSKHKDKIALYQKRYRLEHREEMIVYHAGYREKHKEEILAYRINHKEDIAVRKAIYHKEHKEEINLRHSAWQKANPDNIRASHHRRRFRELGNGGSHTARDIQRQGEMQKWMCWWGGPSCKGYCKDEYDIDHIIPLSKGGHNNPSNIVISCVPCNRSKKINCRKIGLEDYSRRYQNGIYGGGL